MIKINHIVLVVILAAGGVPATASAYCFGADTTLPNYDPRYYSVAKELTRAKYVVLAKVVRETWLGEDGKPAVPKPPFQNGASRPWGFDPYMGAYYDVDVIETFKGNPPKRLRLFSENSTARFWLDINSEVLMFVTEERFDPPVGLKPTLDNCGNSALVKKAQATIRTLRQLTSKK